MPAAAVIPAPIAYTNAVAVKKLVVRQGSDLVLIQRFVTLLQSFDEGRLDLVLQ